MTAKECGFRYSIIPARAIIDPDVSAQALRVLALLGRHTDENGWCRRSQVRMAKELGCSRGTIQNALDILIGPENGQGYVERREENRPGVEPEEGRHPHCSYSYRVRLDLDDEGERRANRLARRVPTPQHAVPSQDKHPVPDSVAPLTEHSPLERSPLEEERESENPPSVKPKEKPSSAWPEIWTAFQGWPGSEKQDWSERKAKTAWEALTPRLPDTDLILCIRAKGRDYAEENLRRKARGADAKWPTNPARWLGERLFDRLLDEARKSVTATLAAEAARPMALSEPIRERLITAGVATGEIKSYFAGCVHRHGPPEEFIFETQFAANLCENRCGARLRRESAFGEDLIIAVAKKVNAA